MVFYSKGCFELANKSRYSLCNIYTTYQCEVNDLTIFAKIFTQGAVLQELPCPRLPIRIMMLGGNGGQVCVMSSSI